MAITTDEVRGVAVLARLRIDEDKVDGVAERFGRVLDLVGELESVDTTGVLPMSNPHDMTQRLRADEITETNQRDSLQESAPEVEDGFFLVPRVID